MSDFLSIDWAIACIAVPLVGAMLAFALPRWTVILGLGAVSLTAVAVVALTFGIMTEGPVVTPLGNWGAPLGIDLRADGLSVTLLAMTAGVGLFVSLGALDSFAAARAPERMRRYFWPLWLFLLTGLNGAYLSTDIFNLYVMLEVIALAAVGLTVLSGRIEAIRAGLEYMYASILGALLFLLGIGFIYLEVGRLDFEGLAGADASPALFAALALMFAGMALKTALFPLHVWLPQAHANATAPASALLSGLVVKVSLYIVLRLSQYMPSPTELLIGMIGAMGAGAILWGSLQALRTDRLKLLVAWSTVAQIGLIFVAFAASGAAGVAISWKAAVILMVAHAVSKAAMFLAAGRIKDEVGHDRIADLDRSPVRPALAQFSFAVAAISLIGLPPSLGFAGKWLLMESALSAGYWPWVAVAMVGTLLSVAYFSRVLVGFLRFDRVRTPLGEHQGWALADAAPLSLALAALALGLFTAPILAFMDIGRPFEALQ